MKKRIIAFTLALAMAALALAACSGSSSGSGSSSSSSSDSGSGESPVELTVAIDAQFTTLDPGLNTEVVNSYVLQHTYAGLFRKDNDGAVQCYLADSYEVSEDGLTYTIKLKDGLTWSDGEPLTAGDFVYALRRNLTYGGDNAWATYDVTKYVQDADLYANNADLEAQDLEDFVGIEAPDDLTVVYHLSKPCAFFTSILLDEIFLPLREDYVEPHGSEWSMDGGYPTNGAYTLEECNENEKVVIVKNDNFFEADEITVDKITFMVMMDADAQEAAFKTGELDIALGVNSTLADTYDDPEDIWIVPSVAVYFVALNSGEAGPEALKDVNVRRALALSIDKEALSNNIGSLYPAINGYVPSGMQGISDDFRVEGDAQEKFLEYDLDTAIELLAEAGYDENNPLKLKYKYSDSQLHADVAQLLQQQWKNAGIDVELVVVESGVFYDQLDNADFEMARYGYSGSTDPSIFLDLWTTAIQIVPSVDDPVFDKMIDDASYIVDHAEYMQALHDAEHYFVQEMVYVIPLFDYSSVALKDPGIDGILCPPGIRPFYGYVTFAE